MASPQNAGRICDECKEPSLHKLLRNSAFSGHVECVKAALRAGVDVNTVDNSYPQHTPLTTADKGREGRPASIRTAADALTTYLRYTSLICAAQNGHVDCVVVLIRAGADVNKRTLNSETALMFAASNGYVNCVDVLIGAGAGVNGQDMDGTTALMKAAYKGHVSCVKTLLEAGADVNKQNRQGNTALHNIAIGSKRFDKQTVNNDVIGAIIVLQAGAKINLTNKDHLNALTKYLGDTRREDQNKEMILLLYAGGETISENKVEVPDYLKQQDISLKNLCREAMRKHLLELDSHAHLFYRAPQLGLPSLLVDYVLYGVSLE